jgi:hypothetical protein
VIVWPPLPPRWVRCFATDVQGGDLVQYGDVEHRVMGRTTTPDYEVAFLVYLPDGSTVPFVKAAKVRIFDPDGSVSARVRELPPDRSADARHDAGAQWVPCYGGDIEPGDLIELHGAHLRVQERTRTTFISPVFAITLPDGSTRNVFKTAKVRVFDPDGSVARRVHCYDHGSHVK